MAAGRAGRPGPGGTASIGLLLVGWRSTANPFSRAAADGEVAALPTAERTAAPAALERRGAVLA